VRLFPQLEQCFAEPHEEAFCCLRRVTPSGLPILGASRHKNLYYNAGQGHLGWTLAHGCARIVADQVAGRSPAIAMDGYLPTPRQ
jgi:D-amino-acid dehydrogenase